MPPAESLTMLTRARECAVCHPAAVAPSLQQPDCDRVAPLKSSSRIATSRSVATAVGSRPYFGCSSACQIVQIERRRFVGWLWHRKSAILIHLPPWWKHEFDLSRIGQTHDMHVCRDLSTRTAAGGPAAAEGVAAHTCYSPTWCHRVADSISMPWGEYHIVVLVVVRERRGVDLALSLMDNARSSESKKWIPKI